MITSIEAVNRLIDVVAENKDDYNQLDRLQLEISAHLVFLNIEYVKKDLEFERAKLRIADQLTDRGEKFTIDKLEALAKVETHNEAKEYERFCRAAQELVNSVKVRVRSGAEEKNG